MDQLYYPHLEPNLQALQQLITWTKQTLDARLALTKEATYTIPPLPNWEESTWGNLLRRKTFTPEECLAIGLGLIPELDAKGLDVLANVAEEDDRVGGNAGGTNGKQHQGILPTGQTLAFLLAATTDLGAAKARQLLHTQHPLIKEGVLMYADPESNEPSLSGILKISHEYLHILTYGTPYIPRLSTQFPAELVTTSMSWDDMVLPENTIFQLQEIMTWMQVRHELIAEGKMQKVLRPGYRAVFHGPSGTGKTLAAQLMAQQLNLPLLKVHTPMLVSKWVGETEKNLNRLFDQASGRDWILLFDEGENLFGQRGGNSTQDQYSNQQIGFLLQKIERYDGLVIISSNRYASMDTAFKRRFESIIHFKAPGYQERLQLWSSIFEGIEIDQREVKFEALAEHYPEITGGLIINILRSARIWAHQQDRSWIKLVDIIRAIQKESYKFSAGWVVKPPEQEAGLTPYLDKNFWL